MTGEWVTTTERPHVCDPPDDPGDRWDGSVWRCECGQRWMLRRGGEQSFSWRRIDAIDYSAFAVGLILVWVIARLWEALS